MANPNNWKQESKPKPYFTDYTLASTPCGLTKAAIMREGYEDHQLSIFMAREDRKVTPRINAQAQPRGGFPKRRERNPEEQSKRGMSKHLNRFKVIGKKIMVLHATLGWRVYA